MRTTGSGSRLRISAVMGFALALLLAGCAKATSPDDVATLSQAGTTAGTAPTGAGVGDEAKLRAYAKCMRDNGIANFPDPTVGADGRARLSGLRGANIDRASTVFQDAEKACAALRAGVTFGPDNANIDRTKLQDGALKYAQCLRDKGLTVKDPQFNQPGAGGPPGGGGGGGQAPPPGQAPGGGGQPEAERNQGQGGAGGRGSGFIARALGLDENDPAVQAAQTACQPVLQQALSDAGIANGPGSGGAPGGGTGQ